MMKEHYLKVFVIVTLLPDRVTNPPKLDAGSSSIIAFTFRIVGKYFVSLAFVGKFPTNKFDHIWPNYS